MQHDLDARLRELERMHKDHNHPEEGSAFGCLSFLAIVVLVIMQNWQPIWWTDFWQARWLDFAHAVVAAGTP